MKITPLIADDRHPNVSLFYVILRTYVRYSGRAVGGLVPGQELAAVLSRIDISALSGYDRVVVLQAHHKMASHHAARAYQAMVAISETMHEMFDDDFELAYRAAATEIRAGLSLTRRAADLELELAFDLWQRLPQPPHAADRPTATSAARPTNRSGTATTYGPAPSATPTPPTANRPRLGQAPFDRAL